MSSRLKSDMDDVSEISDRMESIMARYQHLNIPSMEASINSSQEDANAHELLQMAKQRLSVDMENLKEEENEEENLKGKKEEENLNAASLNADADIHREPKEPEKTNHPTNAHDSSKSETMKSNPKSRSQIEKDELWALLNYSKVRLATGTTPTTSEAIALGMKESSVSQFHKHEHSSSLKKLVEVNTSTSMSTIHDENHPKLKKEHDLDSNKEEQHEQMDDPEEEEDEDDDDEEDDDNHVFDDDLPKFSKEQIEESRARAMATLARTEHIKTKTKVLVPPELSSTSSSSSKSNTPEKLLTDSFLMKSIALAEQAASAGETEFQTANRLSILEQMSTPTAKDRFHRTNHSKGGTTSKTTHSSEPGIGRGHMFGKNMRRFLFNSKQKAENLVKEVKSSISKFENNLNHPPNKNSKEVKSNAVSPLKTFKENILKVEKMNEEKYGEPWEK